MPHHTYVSPCFVSVPAASSLETQHWNSSVLPFSHCFENGLPLYNHFKQQQIRKPSQNSDEAAVLAAWVKLVFEDV